MVTNPSLRPATLGRRFMAAAAAAAAVLLASLSVGVPKAAADVRLHVGAVRERLHP